MAGKEVTDPKLIEQLNAQAAQSSRKEVADPELIKSLEREADARAYRLEGAKGKPGIIEELVGGAKRGWDRGAYGLKGLVTDLTDEDKQQLKEGKAFVEETGPASSGGEIAADIALTGGPVKMGYGVGKNILKEAIPAYQKAQALGRGAVATGTGAATGAAVEPEDRGFGATVGAAGGAIGDAIGAVGKPIKNWWDKLRSQPVKPTAATDVLIDKWDIVPTLGQGAESKGVRTLEKVAAGAPGIRAGVERGQDRSIKEFQDKLFEEATGAGQFKGAERAQFVSDMQDDVLKQTGKPWDSLNPREQVEYAEDALSGRYSEALKGVTVRPTAIVNKQGESALQAMESVAEGMPDDFAKELNKVVEQHLGKLEPGAEMSGNLYKDLINDIGKLAGDMANGSTSIERRAGRRVAQLREELRMVLPEEVRPIDESWTKFRRFADAGKNTLNPDAGISPMTAQQSVRKLSPGNKFAKGEAPGQALTDAAQNLTRAEGNSVAGWGTVLAPVVTGGNPLSAIPALTTGALSAVDASRGALKTAFGKKAWQKKMAERLRRDAGKPANRKGRSAAAASSIARQLRREDR